MAMTEADKKEFKQIVAEGNKALREWLEATLHPIQKDVDKHDIVIQEIPVIKQRLDSHMETHLNTQNKRQFNIEMWVIIGIFLLDKLQNYFGS